MVPPDGGGIVQFLSFFIIFMFFVIFVIFSIFTFFMIFPQFSVFVIFHHSIKPHQGCKPASIIIHDTTPITNTSLLVLTQVTPNRATDVMTTDDY